MNTATNLKPRAIAVLCALRNGGLNRAQIRDAIGDSSTEATRELLGEMRDLDLPLVGQIPGNDRWYLDHGGIGWLQSNGLDAARESRIQFVRECAR